MHARIRRAEMSEETFQILLDIMEKHFANLKIPDSPESDQTKLIRASSFSELPSTRRILIEQCYRDGDLHNLVRQYSCEQILDRDTRTSQIKFSEMVQAGNNEHMKTWRSTFPYLDPGFKIRNWNVQSKNDAMQSIHTPTRKDEQIEYMEVEEESNSTNLPRFAAPIAPTNISAVSTEKSLPKSEKFAKKLVAMKRKLEEDDPSKNDDECNKKPASYQDMKNKIRPLAPKCSPTARTKRSCACFKLIFVITFSIFVALIAILLHQDQDIKHSSDFASAVVELKKRIHGQDNAVRTLSEYLQLDSPPLKVIVLVGGTGVGKSYTVEIVKKNFPRPYFVRQYFPSIETIRDIGFSFLYPNLIIVENLKEHDLADVVKFLKRHQKAYENRYITVLIVFNVEQMEDDSTRSIDLDRAVDKIKNSFVDENIDVKIIPYDSLSENALEKCVTDAAENSELTLSDSQIDLIKQYLLTNKAGCKGAYSKVQVIGRQ